MWMVDFDRDLARSRQLSKTAGVRANWKSDELDSAYLVGRHLAIVEARAHTASVEDHPQMTLQTHQARKLDVALGRVRIFYQQGREEFARAWEEFVIGLDLVVDRRVLENALRAQDFLNLIPDGLPVLEHQRQMRSDGKAAARFLGDAQRTQQWAHAIVRVHRQHFEWSYRSHASLLADRRLRRGHWRGEAVGLVSARQDFDRVEGAHADGLFNLDRG